MLFSTTQQPDDDGRVLLADYTRDRQQQLQPAFDLHRYAVQVCNGQLPVVFLCNAVLALILMVLGPRGVVVFVCCSAWCCLAACLSSSFLVVG